MRVAHLVAAGMFLVGCTGPVLGQDQAHERAAINFDGTPEQLANVRYANIEGILQEITTAKAAAKDEKTSTWLDQLGTIYASMTGAQIWTDDDGFTSQARAVIAGLNRADDWGLRASDYRLPEFPAGKPTTATLARMEVSLSMALIKYASHARGGRIEPTDLSLWLDRKIQPVDAIAVIKSFANARDVETALAELHPHHPQFERLRRAYLDLKKPAQPKKPSHEDIRVPARGPKLRPGATHPDIAIIRRRLNVPAVDGDPETYDPELARAVRAFMRTQGWKRKRTIDNRVRAALNRPKKKRSKRLAKTSRRDLLLVNMEKWRWMPDDLGDLHIWNNLPAFTTKVMKNDRVIHSERIIIGKSHTQTPVFSDEITHVVFKPEWGVPSSIKVRSLLPRLAGGDYGVLARRGMSIKYDDGTIQHPSRVNWARTDIRSIPIVQGPGASNPLGRVKFIFPNEHSVYMHDTPQKHLFKNAKRTFSHGCIRVRNPVRLAELLLDETAGWNEDQVADQFRRRAPGNNKVPLPEPIPVHNVYFTAVIDENTGKLTRLEDIYQHDKRILDALNGKPAELIAKSDPARAQKRENERLAKAPPIYRPPTDVFADGYQFGTPQGFLWGKPKKWGSYQAAKPPKKGKKRWRRRGPKQKPFSLNAYQVY